MDDESLVGFNFWPSFADLMLATVFVLVLIIFLVAFSLQRGNINLQRLQNKQREVAETINTQYGDSLQVRRTDQYYIVWKDGQENIHIYNDIQLQRITFSDNVLFSPDDYHLTNEGRCILSEVGSVIKDKLSDLKKIDIEGHSDTVPTYQYERGNLELGALRAISVFQYLKNEVGINPARQLMSATSFGVYKPVQRTAGAGFGPNELASANETDSLRSRNRRVELLLFYKNVK